MAENIEKELVNDPENTLSEKPSEEITPISDTKTINPNQENENMEVHKHPHHVAHKKKWFEYLLEFLMLFLAVYLGFIAENIREHRVEKAREKQYIISLIGDLKDDIANLDNIYKSHKKGVELLDSLFNLLSHPELAKQHGDDFYYYARLGPRFNPFANNEKTYDQLKNSGAFRLIENQKISNEIMNYYLQFPLYRHLEELYIQEFQDYKRIAAKVIDPSIFRKQEDLTGNILRGNDNPILRTYNPEVLNELGLWVVYINGTRRSMLPLTIKMKESAGKIIESLQNEYQLAP